MFLKILLKIIAVVVDVIILVLEIIYIKGVLVGIASMGN